MRVVFNVPKVPVRPYGEHIVLANVLKALVSVAPRDWELVTHTVGYRGMADHSAALREIDPLGRLARRQTVLPYTVLEPFIRNPNFPGELLFGEHDLVHSFSGLVPRCRNLVVTIHDLIFLRLPEVQQTPGFVAKCKDTLTRLVSQAAVVHTVSEYSKSEIVSWLGADPDRVVAIPNGIDRDVYKPVDESCRAVSDAVLENFGIRRPYLLHAGGNARRKNLVRLVEVYRLLRANNGINHSLVLVGSYYTEELAAAAGKYRDDVRCLGYISRADSIAILQRADVLVFPSLYEGFGLPPLEAMACGVPTAVANSSALPEVCGDAAQYFDPLDVEDIAAATLKLLTDPRMRSSCVERGMRRAASFSWHRLAENLISVYGSVVQGLPLSAHHLSLAAPRGIG